MCGYLSASAMSYFMLEQKIKSAQFKSLQILYSPQTI